MSDSKKIEDLNKELDAMKKRNEFLQEFINKGENNWTEKDIKDFIAYLDYGKGSEEGDNLILKIVKHKNLTSGWLEDFCLSGLHPIKVIKNALKNPNIDSWLLNELYERDKSQNDEKAEWRYIDYEILHHPLCPKDIKYVYIDIYYRTGKNNASYFFHTQLQIKEEKYGNFKSDFIRNYSLYEVCKVLTRKK